MSLSRGDLFDEILSHPQGEGDRRVTCPDRDQGSHRRVAHDGRSAIVQKESQHDERVRDAPQHRDEEEEGPGASIHNASLVAYRGKR